MKVALGNTTHWIELSEVFEFESLVAYFFFYDIGTFSFNLLGFVNF